MSNTSFDAQEDLGIANQMMARGRLAAALDGVHLISWGFIIVCILSIQYFAEAKDWLPSSLLWLWQPFVFAALGISLFLGKTSAARRWKIPASRAYVTAFASVGFSLALYAIISGINGRPDQYILVLLSSCTLGCAFFVTSVVTGMPALRFAAFGWWLTFGFFALRGELVLSDFFILCAAVSLFMIAPGIYLTHRRHQLAIEVS